MKAYEQIAFSHQRIHFSSDRNVPSASASPEEIFATDDELADYHADITAWQGCWDAWNQPDVEDNGIKEEAKHSNTVTKATKFMLRLATELEIEEEKLYWLPLHWGTSNKYKYKKWAYR